MLADQGSIDLMLLLVSNARPAVLCCAVATPSLGLFWAMEAWPCCVPASQPSAAACRPCCTPQLQWACCMVCVLARHTSSPHGSLPAAPLHSPRVGGLQLLMLHSGSRVWAFGMMCSGTIYQPVGCFPASSKGALTTTTGFRG